MIPAGAWYGFKSRSNQPARVAPLYPVPEMIIELTEVHYFEVMQPGRVISSTWNDGLRVQPMDGHLPHLVEKTKPPNRFSQRKVETMLPYVILHMGVSVDGRIDWGLAPDSPYYDLVPLFNADTDISGSNTFLKAEIPEEPDPAFAGLYEEWVNKPSRALLA